jgi:hypothetical protein
MQHRAIIAYVNQPRQKLERLRQPGQAISRGARKDASPYCYNPASCPIKKRPSKNFNYGRDYRRFHDTEPVGSLKSQIDGSSRFAHALGSGCIVAVAGSRERIGARRAFCPSLVTVALEQRLARAKCRSPASRRADCCSGKPAAATVLMPVFNNLVLFDQHKEKNTLDTIVPDLAESWNLERGRQGADLQVPARGQLADTPNPHHSREPGRGIF